MSDIKDLFINHMTARESALALNLEALTGKLSGSTWRDQSGNGNHGTLTGCTLSPQAPSKPLRHLDGNLVYNGDFSVRPYLVEPTSTDDRFIDGTASGAQGEKSPFFWGMNGGGGGTYQASFVTKDGRNAILLETTSAGAYIEVLGGKRGGIINRKIVPVKPNTTYRYSVWQKTEVISGDATNGTWFNMLEVDSTNTGIVSNNTPFVKTTANWTLHTVEFTTNASTVAIEPRIQVYGHQGAATLIMKAWFSDIKLIEV